MTYKNDYIKFVLDHQYPNYNVFDISNDVKKFRHSDKALNYLELNDNKLFSTRRPNSDSNFGLDYSSELKKYNKKLKESFVAIKESVWMLNDGKNDNKLAIVVDNMVISSSPQYLDYRLELLNSGAHLDIYQLPNDSSYYNKKTKDQKKYDRCSLVVFSYSKDSQDNKAINLWWDYETCYTYNSHCGSVFTDIDSNEFDSDPIFKSVFCIDCDGLHGASYYLNDIIKTQETKVACSLLPWEVHLYQKNKNLRYKLGDICSIKQGVYSNKFKKSGINITDDKSDIKQGKGFLKDIVIYDYDNYIFPVRLKDVQYPFLSKDVIAKRVEKETKHDFNTWRILPGDVVMTLSGSNIRSSIVKNLQAKYVDEYGEEKLQEKYYVATNNILVLRPKAGYMSEYIHIFVNGKFFEDYMKLEQLTKPMKSVNIETLLNAPLPVDDILRTCTEKNSNLLDYKEDLSKLNDAQKTLDKHFAKIENYQISLIEGITASKDELEEIDDLGTE